MLRNSQKLIIFFVFVLDFPILYSADCPVLENIIMSVTNDTNVINARKQYDLSLINKKYRFLQWWSPSFTLSNNLIYPYKKDEFDDKLTSNTTSLDLSLPLPTGSILGIGGSYTLARDILETSTLEKQDWGYSQDAGFNVSFSQRINPWWLHTRRSPYSRLAGIQNMLAYNDYNSSVRNTLFSAVEAYINLRKIERSIKQIHDAFIVYDELLQAYRELLASGGTSWREYEKIRSEKWDYESELFTLENNRMSIQRELYSFIGTVTENICDEILAKPDHVMFTQMFSGLSRQAIVSLEENSFRLQKESLEASRILDRQTNSPGLKVTWGTSYKLPVKSSDSLWDAWEEKDNFDDNKLNNWSLTILIDLSSLLSPVNIKNTSQYNAEIKILNELLKTFTVEKNKEMLFTKRMATQLEDQIKILSSLIINETVQLNEDEKLKDAGAITVLEYNQSGLKLNEKITVLNNLQDDLWFYRFISAFYFSE
jgi:hypothetical protein